VRVWVSLGFFVADLEQAIRLRTADHPTSATSGFVLAMAHWQLGEQEQARAWFDKSVAWMDKGLKNNAELRRFRAEAAELLGVKDRLLSLDETTGKDHEETKRQEEPQKTKSP
jgi:hypothetical protein